jgi:hypothetical protein
MAIDAPEFDRSQALRQIRADCADVDSVHDDAAAKLENGEIGVRVQRAFDAAVASGRSTQRIRQPGRDRGQIVQCNDPRTRCGGDP